MYRSWLEDPQSVEASWDAFFKGFDFALSSANGAASSGAPKDADALFKEFGVIGLIHGYRDRGHVLSTTNPLVKRKDRKPRLDLENYGLSEADLDTHFVAGYEIGMPNATLRQIVDRLKEIYCGNIGFENAFIHDYERRMWLRNKIESRPRKDDYGLPLEKKRRILEKLNGAVGFEDFLHKKFVGQKTLLARGRRVGYCRA